MFERKHLFSYISYRDYLRDCIDYKDFKVQEVESYLNYKSSSLSKIIYGNQDLPTDKAFKLCDFLKLKELEKNYFINIVELENAGTEGLKGLYKKKREIILRKALNFSNLDEDKEINIRKKSLKNLDFFNKKGFRSVYTMHSEFHEEDKYIIDGVYTKLIEEIKTIISKQRANQEKQGYYFQLNLLQIT